MESVPCNLCGSTELVRVRNVRAQQYGEGARFSIVRCRACDLVYVSPRPTRAAIGAFYPQQYQAEMRRLLQAGMANPVIRAAFRMVRRRRTPPFVPDGHLLEIGCAGGVYLAGMRELGWNVQGVEIDSVAAEFARDEYGLCVQTGDAQLVLPQFPDGSFDVVTMWHVLEHFHDPIAILTEVQRILKPGGMLMLELPNYASPLAALLGEFWFPLEIPRHLYHFTPWTLQAMLAKVGLYVSRSGVRGVLSPETLVWSIGHVMKTWRGKPHGGDLSLNPALLVAALPPSWLLARSRRSDHLSVTATKPVLSI